MMQKLIAFGREVFQHFSKSNTFQEGAALAYYTVFSLLPMLIIVVSIFGMIWGEAAVSGELYKGLANVLGETSAKSIEQIIKQQHQHHRPPYKGVHLVQYALEGFHNVVSVIRRRKMSSWLLRCDLVSTWLPKHTVPRDNDVSNPRGCEKTKARQFLAGLAHRPH